MLGFIIIRHVNSKKTNYYWNLCIKKIREFYPENKIIVIDDNSNYKYVRQIGRPPSNCEFIQGEFKGRGEFLPYYYFYKTNYFDCAFICHDSTFLQKKLEIEHVDTVRLLWEFEHTYDNLKRQLNLLKNLENENLIEFHKNYKLWKGCFGVMSMINHSFLKKIVEKYNIFKLLDHLLCREDRMDLERVLPSIFFYEDKDLIKNPSIFGNIHNYIKWAYNFEEYLMDFEKKNKKIINLPIIKVWSGR